MGHLSRPINLPGGITLGKKGMEVQGRPSFAQYEAAGAFIQRAHQVSGWWLADWIVYGDSRPEWKAEIDAATGIDQLQPQTVRQYRMLAKRYPVSNRIDGVEFGHHAAVAHFEPKVREKVLQAALAEGWSTRETLHAAKQAARQTATVAQGQASTVHQVEVSVLCSVEADTPGMAEAAAWEALRTILKGGVTGFLAVKVIASHARPTVEEP